MVAESRHRLVAILTSVGPGRFRGATVGEVAQRLGVPVWPAARVREPELAPLLRAEGVDLLLNVHSLHIVDARVLEAPRIGCFNLHPGPLPEYAGLNAPSWALYQGETSHGVTLHWMRPGVDRGPIAYEARFPIAPDDTALTVSARCTRLGVGLVRQLLEAAAQQRGERRRAIPAIPQDLDRWRYFGRDIPSQGWIDWSRPAREVVNFVRACDYGPLPSPWGQPRARLEGGEETELAILQVAVTGAACDAPPGTVRRSGVGGGERVEVATGDEWLRIERMREGTAVLRDGARLAPLGRSG